MSTARDRRIAALAGSQHGVVTTAQLHALGLDKHAIAHRVRSGRLHLVDRCVYAVGHAALSERGRWMAAVLSCGHGAALTGEGGAALLRVLPWTPSGIDVLVPRPTRRRRLATVHLASSLRRSDTTVRDGIRTARVGRILLDLARSYEVERLARVMDEAAFQQEPFVTHAKRLVRDHRGRAGSRVLRDALDLHLGGSSGTHSEFERRFLALVRAAGLPEPRVNVRVAIAGTRYPLDFHWPAHRVVVETDGWASHSRARAREADARRDLDLVTEGWRVLRVTWRMLADEPDLIVARLCVLLGQGVATPGRTVSG